MFVVRLMNYTSFINKLTDKNFNIKALELFRWQAKNNAVYRKFVSLLNFPIQRIKHYSEIPHLPVELFKNHSIICGESIKKAQLVFKSSGTTSDERSQHFVFQPEIYQDSILRSFKPIYGNPKDYCFLALLPSYIEQKNSSLIYMVDFLMQQSNHTQNNYYLYNFDELAMVLTKLEKAQQKTLLIGVSYALLDFAAQFPMPLKHTIVMETGGMKGRRREMIKTELHKHLKTAFEVNEIHSEYGMTELLSQSYSTGKGIFRASPLQKIIIKDLYDPFAICKTGQSGRINVIDLANIDSCAFLQTADLGKTYADGTFEVLGRIDNSDIRGCNLMV